jgi:hypothetical protein
MATIAAVIASTHHPFYYRASTSTGAERPGFADEWVAKVTSFELGAHPFLTLTLFIAMFERDYAEPLGFQREYARRLSQFTLPYPDIAT